MIRLPEFKPLVHITEMKWFPEVQGVTCNFRLRLQDVKNDSVIVGLADLADAVGYKSG